VLVTVSKKSLLLRWVEAYALAHDGLDPSAGHDHIVMFPYNFKDPTCFVQPFCSVFVSTLVSLDFL